MLCASTVLLVGCGTSPGDRGLSGGLLGAGTGATIGAMAGSAGTGALWGGLGGAAIGLLTSSGTLNLGQPIWNRASWNHSASAGHHRRHASRTRYARSDCATHETTTQRITTCPKAD